MIQTRRFLTSTLSSSSKVSTGKKQDSEAIGKIPFINEEGLLKVRLLAKVWSCDIKHLCSIPARDHGLSSEDRKRNTCQFQSHSLSFIPHLRPPPLSIDARGR